MSNLPRTADEHRAWWSENTNVPYGTCWCGCGLPVPRSKQTIPRRLLFRGMPTRYVHGHWKRTGPVYVIEDRGFATPCWIWAKTKSSGGYGMMWHEKRMRNAHVVMWERRFGPVPSGLCLDHLCRVRACVNPDHLEPVTSRVNTQRGKNVKLTPQRADDIKAIYLTGRFTQQELAEVFGVDQTTISGLMTRDMWVNEH